MLVFPIVISFGQFLGLIDPPHYLSLQKRKKRKKQKCDILVSSSRAVEGSEKRGEECHDVKNNLLFSTLFVFD